MAAMDQLLGLTQVIGSLNNLVGGQSQSTSQSQTTQTNVTEAGIQRIIQQMLSGPGGVKDVSGAARGAGLYNSTTELQNLNDLNTRVAGEAARLSAPTTVTTEQQTATPGVGLGGLIAPIAALAGMGQLNNLGTSISGMLGSGAAPAAASAGASGVSASPSFVSGGTALGSLGSGAITTAGGAQLGGSLLSSLSDLSPAIAGGATQVGSAAAGQAVASSLGSALSANTVPILGNFLTGLFGDSDSVKDPASLATATGMGAIVGGPVGAIAAPLAILGGSLLGELSIVCTALQAKGLLDADKYAKGQVYLQKLHSYTKLGYYWLARDWAKKINEGDVATIALCLPWAYSRTELIAKPSVWNHIKFFRGTLTRVIGQPMCFVIGAVLSASGKTKDDVLTPSQVD